VIHVKEAFSVPSGPRTVWRVISDPRQVVECVPGASLDGEREDGSYDASVTVKFGPVKVAFRGEVTLDLDAAAMVGRVSAHGRDNQGGARVTSGTTFRVTPEGESGSAVSIDGEVDISGKLAGVIEAGAPLVVKTMSREFASNLARRCVEVSKGEGT